MKNYKWSIIGAGPAGIAALGQLLDYGIEPHQIAWIDPEFHVGELGTKWHRVEGNTKVSTFIDFLTSSSSFQYRDKTDCILRSLDVNKSCRLSLVAEPLAHITHLLMKKVTIYQEKVLSLHLDHNQWHINLSRETIHSEKVILAIGAKPKTLDYSVKEIPLSIALNDLLLKKEVLTDEIIGVFGASHSAIVALENLSKQKIKKIMNFYQHPLKYALYLENFTLFDNTGLKGHAAEWAKKNIDGTLLPHLERIHCQSPHFLEKVNQCTRLIYAIGFEPNTIHVEGYPTLHYNKTNGIIAPGLFGLGIAYPQLVSDPLGNVEYNVGLWKFFQYLQTCLPLWLKYHA